MRKRLQSLRVTVTLKYLWPHLDQSLACYSNNIASERRSDREDKARLLGGYEAAIGTVGALIPNRGPREL